ncbi:MAG: ATP-binding protein [Deltaproteobacteria bacterium]|nr:ATP-binding protein [Deltaproteobacteria bacterium]
MIVSFTGAQSTGKTTLLNLIGDLNPYLDSVDEVTRRIKREFDLPINEDGSDVTQSMIMADHIANVYRKYDSDVILDRCAMDGVVYTHWLYNTGKVSKSVLKWAQTIYQELISNYDVIFYTSPDDVPLVDDGERSVNMDFRDDILTLFDDYISGLIISGEADNIYKVKGTVEERMTFIKKVLEDKGLDIKIR